MQRTLYSSARVNTGRRRFEHLKHITGLSHLSSVRLSKCRRGDSTDRHTTHDSVAHHPSTDTLTLHPYTYMFIVCLSFSHIFKYSINTEWIRCWFGYLFQLVLLCWKYIIEYFHFVHRVKRNQDSEQNGKHPDPKFQKSVSDQCYADIIYYLLYLLCN